jgi:hypothetical protein
MRVGREPVANFYEARQVEPRDFFPKLLMVGRSIGRTYCSLALLVVTFQVMAFLYSTCKASSSPPIPTEYPGHGPHVPGSSGPYWWLGLLEADWPWHSAYAHDILNHSRVGGKLEDTVSLPIRVGSSLGGAYI